MPSLADLMKQSAQHQPQPPQKSEDDGRSNKKMTKQPERTQRVTIRPPQKKVIPKPIKPVAPPAKDQPILFRWSVESIASDNHRERNEDSWLINSKSNLLGVFDGVGSADQAALASQKASEAFELIATDFANLKDPKLIQEKFVRKLQEIHTNLRQLNHPDQLLYASTAAVVHLLPTPAGAQLVFATVGDSRVSILRKQANRFELTTIDDHIIRYLILPNDQRPAWINDILRDANLDPYLVIPPDEAVNLAAILDQSPNPPAVSAMAKFLFNERNILTQSLGIDEVRPHVGVKDLVHGDKVILATDGLHDNLLEQDIRTTLSQTGVGDAAGALAIRAHEVSQSTMPRAKKDDITVIVIEII